MEALGPGQRGQVLVGFLEVRAVLDQLRAEGSHGGVLFRAIATRDHDHRSQSGAGGGEGHALAVIAASGRGHTGDARFAVAQLIHVDDSPAHFESSGGSVVLVLDPYLGARAGAQQRPADLGSRRHDSIDEFSRGL